MISYFLWTILQRSPALLVVLVGIVFSSVRWKRHPKVSLVTLTGLVLYLLRFLIFAALYYSVPKIKETMQLSYAAANNLFDVLNVLNDLAFAAVIILLVIAAFMKRQPVAATST